MLLVLALAGWATVLPAAGPAERLGFQPLAEGNAFNATSIRLPEGFDIKVLLRAGELISRGGRFPANPDMNVVVPGGRFLFTSHEHFNPLRLPGEGSLTRTDLVTRKTVLMLRGLNAADGLKWTPWDTLLLGEESARGSVWEVQPWSGYHVRREPLGRFSHEGIVVTPDGSVYQTDEYERGAVYKFVPAAPLGRESLAAGTLYVLVPERGWVVIRDPANARQEALGAGALTFNRPEDMELGPDGRIYIAVTAEHRIVALDDAGASPRISEYVAAGASLPGGTLRWPDNLAFDARGNLYITEDVPLLELQRDNSTNDVWVALPDSDGDGRSDGLHRFAAWGPGAAEPSGPAFSPDGKRLYINTMGEHSALSEVRGFSAAR